MKMRKTVGKNSPSHAITVTLRRAGRLLAFVFLAGLTLASAGAAPGANVPWITYEAEEMKTTGVILGPNDGPNTVAWESSGGSCVKLSTAGQYVEFAARAAANAMVVRYSLPDSADGTGVDSTIGLYINGVFVKKLPITSRYSWLYGKYPFSNIPAKTPRNLFDEVRSLGLSIQAGDRIRLQKDADAAASWTVIDLVDLEKVAPPLARPPGNWLSITDAPYNAVGNGLTDDTAVLQDCVNDAVRQGKNVWVPAGTYLITADLNNLHGVSVQGAGMWHTTFVGDPVLYANPNRRVRFNGGGSNVHLSDFAIMGRLNYRNDSEANDGLGGSFGTGSVISRVWVEHVKTGFWMVNSSGLVIDGCRVRDTVADGINLCVGMQNTVVTNCAIRGTGDDCFAMWPATYRSQAYTPGGNVFTHCTGRLPFLANGGALYGGMNNRIEDCLFQDIPYGCGVLISGTFPVGANKLGGRTVVQRCKLVRCGGYDHSYRWRAALQFTMENNPVTNVCLNHLDIIDSLSDGLSVIGTNLLSGVTVSELHIPNFGLGTRGRHGLWAAEHTEGSLNISDSTVAEYRDDSTRFTFNFGRAVGAGSIRPAVSPRGSTTPVVFQVTNTPAK